MASHESPQSTPADIWRMRYDMGCEWCGRKIPALKNNGLEQAHIFAAEHGPVHDWNILLLCPTCHTIFDDLIKPKIQKAFEKAVGGFNDPPTNKNITLKVAQTYKEAIERLIEPKAGQRAIKLPPESPDDGIATWKADSPERRKRYSRQS